MPKITKTYFKKLGTGYRFDPYDGRDKIFLAPPRILPKHIDNREECTAAKAKEYPIAKYERCLGIDHIKHAIHYRGCVIAGVNVHKGWFSTIGKGIIPFKSSYLQEGGHAITFVGYDDEKEVFWLKNSWGKEWGKKGFAGLTYKDALVNIHDVWMTSIPE